MDNEFEKKKLELEYQRLELDKMKAENERRFLNRHFGMVISSVISLAAIIVSGIQVWDASLKRDFEMKLAQTELEMTKEEQDKRYKLDLATFVSQHQKDIFSTDTLIQKMIRNVMLISFPSELTDATFLKIEQTINDTSNTVWGEGRNIAEKIKLNTALEKINEQVVKASEDLTIQFFTKRMDTAVVRSELSATGFRVLLRRSGNSRPVNTLWYSPEVQEEEIRMVALAVMKLGEKIYKIAPMRRVQSGKLIQVGSGNISGRKAMSVEKILKMPLVSQVTQ